MFDINNYPSENEIKNAFNKDGFKDIHQQSFVYNNFLSDELCDQLVLEMLNGKYTIYSNNGIRFYDLSVDEKIKNMIFNISSPWVKNGGFVFCHIEQNSWCGDHRDSSYDYNLSGWHIWGGVIYLTNFKGGDMVYPEHNVRYHAKKGDLILHTGNTLHYVDHVESSDRYTITFYLWKEDKEYV